MFTCQGIPQGAAAHGLCSRTPQGLAAALPNPAGSGMCLDPRWDRSLQPGGPHVETRLAGLGLCSQCGTRSVSQPSPSFSLFPLSAAVCLAGKIIFSLLFSLAVLAWVQRRGCGSIPGWHRDPHPAGGALSTAEPGCSPVGGVPAPRFWVGGGRGRGALAGTGPAPAALFLSPCLERFSLYQRLRVFSAGD